MSCEYLYVLCKQNHPHSSFSCRLLHTNLKETSFWNLSLYPSCLRELKVVSLVMSWQLTVFIRRWWGNYVTHGWMSSSHLTNNLLLERRDLQRYLDKTFVTLCWHSTLTWQPAQGLIPNLNNSRQLLNVIIVGYWCQLNSNDAIYMITTVKIVGGDLWLLSLVLLSLRGFCMYM